MCNITIMQYPEAARISSDEMTKLAKMFAHQNPDVIESPDLAGVVYDDECDSWYFAFKINTRNKPGIQALFDKYDESGTFDPDDEISASGFIEFPETMSQEILRAMNVVSYPIDKFELCANGDLLLLPKGNEYSI